MSRIPKVFFVSIYGLTAMASLMLVFAEESAFPQILTPPLAVVAYLLTNRTRRMRLPVLWANVLGLIAFLIAGYRMIGTTTEERLLAGAHLVVYLTWIVLFQEKRLSQYWFMCALSVPQVAVGAILTNSGAYGGMLILFMFMGIWTLSVFALYQAYLQYGEFGGASDNGRALLAAAPVGAKGGKRGGANLVRNLLLRPSVSRGTIQLDPDERWLGARYGLSMLAVTSAALVVALAFFLFIPRLWAGRTEWGSSDTHHFKSIAIAGFTEKVRLGDMVPLLENPQRVLEVSLTDQDGLPVDVVGYCKLLGYSEPLFRGATMESYDNGAWDRLPRKGETTILMPIRAESPHWVRQQILMEPIGTPILFAIHPVRGMRIPKVQEAPELHLYSNQLFRPDNVSPDKALSYEVYSPQRDEFPRSAFTFTTSYSENESRPDDEGFSRMYRSLPEGQLPRLVKLARQLTGYDPNQPSKKGESKRLRHRRYIEILSQYLRDSGTYRYSLDATTQDPSLDPVEDFLFNRKAGHCQYFASALTLMLRAVGIPARLVSGFKGGAVNQISGVYEVEQRHAHTWVEVIQSGNFFDDGTIDSAVDMPKLIPYWYVITVDPTPEAREDSVASYASSIRTAHELASAVSSMWSDFLNVDYNEQQSSFYFPILKAVREWWQPSTGDRPFLVRLIVAVVAFVTDPTQWFTVTGLVTATVLWIVIAALVLLLRWRRGIWMRLRALWRVQPTEREIRIAFYVRFEKLCAQMGLVRSRYETQREFAGTVGPRIRHIVVSPDGLPELPARLVEFFYLVRFGDEDLPLSVIDEFDRGLTSLETALKTPQRK